MRIHILQHVPFEGPAAIADWAQYRGHSLTTTRLFSPRDQLPPPNSMDMLVIMGGPMGVHDSTTYPWLTKEMDFVGRILTQGTKILGICLGAQILAYVLGAQVTRNSEREIGWFPIRTPSDIPKSFSQWFPPEYTAFHWHGETFSIPAGAILLGSSAACRNQGFLWNKQALALQFHLETTSASTENLLTHCGDDVHQPGPFVQTAEQIRSGATQYASTLNRTLTQLLDQWSVL
ncbi:MAG TPA: type 1 glutamine amidotransferase [Fibrobacteraceae bacterium]|nr:type 1 glutamine amidotransferase [Fibrobacteraceae bacterium]